jgi:hypothetical protein
VAAEALMDFTPTDFDATRAEPGFVGWTDNGPIFRAPAADFALIGEGPLFWPRADERIQRAATDGGSMLGGPPKGLWHTTETSTWPGYSTGSFPHLTVMVTEGERFTARQHIPFTRAARALRNESGGVQTNRITRCQVEIVTRADVVDTHGLHPAMEDGLASLAEWLEANWGVPRVCMVRFLTYPESFGDNGVRLRGAAWEHYTGWLGHQHADENDHGDPGALNWRPILGFATEEDDVTKDEFIAAWREITAGGIIAGQDSWADYFRVAPDRLSKIIAAQASTNAAVVATNERLDRLIELLTPAEPPPPA